MNKLFVHNPLFRLIGPLFTGTMVYVLILLVNNNVAQLQEQFLGEELYVCIGLSYIIQEFSRLFIVFFDLLKKPTLTLWRFLTWILGSVLISVLLVTLSMYLYYDSVLGYKPNGRELLLFNAIFSLISLIYGSLYLSHHFLYRINIEKVANEEFLKNELTEDFNQFKRGVNPQLLFESLELVLALMQEDTGLADECIDQIATVYRYILASKGRQLVTFDEERQILDVLLQLFDNLPYRNCRLGKVNAANNLVVPGSVLFVVEQIVRSTIASNNIKLEIDIDHSGKELLLSYEMHERINTAFQNNDLDELVKSYSVYSDVIPRIETSGTTKTVLIPLLNLPANNSL